MRVTLVPVYDFGSWAGLERTFMGRTAAQGKLALSVNGIDEAPKIGLRQWMAMATDAGVDPESVVEEVRAVARTLPDAIAQARGDARATDENREQGWVDRRTEATTHYAKRRAARLEREIESRARKGRGRGLRATRSSKTRKPGNEGRNDGQADSEHEQGPSRDTPGVTRIQPPGAETKTPPQPTPKAQSESRTAWGKRREGSRDGDMGKLEEMDWNDERGVQRSAVLRYVEDGLHHAHALAFDFVAYAQTEAEASGALSRIVEAEIETGRVRGRPEILDCPAPERFWRRAGTDQGRRTAQRTGNAGGLETSEDAEDERREAELDETGRANRRYKARLFAELGRESARGDGAHTHLTTRIMSGVARIFEHARKREIRQALASIPPLSGTRWDALIAASAETMARKHGLAVPAWVEERERFLNDVWCMAVSDEGVVPALVLAPIGYVRRNIVPDLGSLARRCEDPLKGAWRESWQ